MIGASKLRGSPDSRMENAASTRKNDRGCPYIYSVSSDPLKKSLGSALTAIIYLNIEEETMIYAWNFLLKP